MEKQNLEHSDSDIRPGSGYLHGETAAGSFDKKELVEDPDAHLSDEERKKIVRFLLVIAILYS